MSDTSIYGVFVPGGMPTVTYERRPRLERWIISKAQSPHQIMMITGPTKSGKSVLVKRVLGDDSIWISGGEAGSSSDVWRHMCQELGVTISSHSVGHSDLLDDPRASESNHATTSTTKSAPVETVQKRALEALRASGRPLVLDDFHYFDAQSQRKIIRSLKAVLFDGHPIVVIAVPHHVYDVVRAEPEMTGRVIHLPIPLWEPSELESIAVSGFRELNVRVDPDIINVLARQAAGSPNLMQTFCLEVCIANEVEGRSLYVRDATIADRQDFFNRCAMEVAHKVAFAKLMKGPRGGGARKRRQFLDGHNAHDIYFIVLFCLAVLGPRSQVSAEELRIQMRSFLVPEDVPRRSEIARVLRNLGSIAAEVDGEPVIEWFPEDDELHITDPYFSFYLRFVGGFVGSELNDDGLLDF